MLGHAGAIFAIDCIVNGDLGADVGTPWWQAGARERRDGDQEGQVEPAWGAWRLPDGKCQWGLMVNDPLWGPYSLLDSLAES